MMKKNWCSQHEKECLFVSCDKCGFWFCAKFYGLHCPRCGKGIKVVKIIRNEKQKRKRVAKSKKGNEINIPPIGLFEAAEIAAEGGSGETEINSQGRIYKIKTNKEFI